MWRRTGCLGFTALVAGMLASCAGPASPATTATLATTATTAPASQFAVGARHEVFNDDHRSTPANGTVPAHPGRRLATAIWYPAVGRAGGQVVEGAKPDVSAGPYPLIVFAHGFTGTGDGYQAVLSRWAGAGYVVAAPDFPLSNGRAPGGPNFTDFVAQPGDMSFVITQLEQETSRTGNPLTGLIDRQRIGVGGHSLGAMTTLGLTGNTCCQDRRIHAVVVMAGYPIAWPGGTYMAAGTPPILVLHGDADETVPYAGGQAAFAGAAPPKFMVTLVGGSHSGPYVDTADRAFAVVVRTTVAFFDYFLKGDRSALDRLRRSGQVTGVAHEDAEHAVAAGPSPTTPTTPTTPSSAGVPPSGRHATASPSQGLHDGETIEVTWSGFPHSGVVNVLECSGNPPKGSDDCDLLRAMLLRPSDTRGSGQAAFVVHVGPVGRGQCDAGHGCVMVVNLAGSLASDDNVGTPISFAA